MAINYTLSTGSATAPSWLSQYLQTGAQGAGGLLGQNTLANQSQNTLDAQQMAAAQARAGSPANAAASQYVTGAINGNYLPGQSQANPYLDATFNQAANSTRSQLASQFAGSGRNIDASYAPRADQLNQLATSIYGGAYNNERALQQQAAGMAGQVSQNNYMDANALSAVGAAQDARAQQVADQPGQSLDDYLRRIGGVSESAGRETTQSQPYYTNNTANYLGTALGLDQLTGGRISGAVGDYLGGLLGGGGAAGAAAAAPFAGTSLGAGTSVGAFGSGAFGASGAAALPVAGIGGGSAAGGAGLLGGTATGAGGAVGGAAAGGAAGLAPYTITGAAANGAIGGGAAASTGGAAGLNLATLGPIGGAIAAAMILRQISNVDRSSASGTTDPYAGLFTDMGYGGLQGNDPSNPEWQSEVAGVDPNSGIRWQEEGGKTTWTTPDGQTYITRVGPDGQPYLTDK